MYRFIATAALCVTQILAQPFQVGSKVTDFQVRALSGNAAKFSELRGPVTVVVFMSTRCPVSNAYDDRMNAIYKDYAPKGVKFLFLNANANEPVEEVNRHRVQHNFAFEVYKDVDNQAADLFGAMATPETYVIDKDNVLRYRGYIDDSQVESRVKTQGLRLAIDAVLAGKTVERSETKAFGCSIKRVRRGG